MDRERLAQLHSRAEAKLGRIPGVMGVGFGLKEVGGLTTEERAFRVYVREKKPLADVPADEVLPREFEGIPVDVLVVRDFEPLHCEDMTQHHPLIGGISITNFYISADDKYGSGTLGFFATLDGVSGPKNVVLVSNSHVLMANGATVGNTIYQPKYVDQGGGRRDRSSCRVEKRYRGHPRCGSRWHAPLRLSRRAAEDYYVDASDALLNISVSSWCDSNCGVSYRNEIRQFDIGGNNRIEGVVRVTQVDVEAVDYAVFKVGRKTSKTVGKVVDAAAVLTSTAPASSRSIPPRPTATDGIGSSRRATPARP